MPWTESRSRDEWLAEVRRRGERIRRRRRTATALVGALVLAVPVGAAVTLLGGRTDRGVALTVAAPPPPSAGDSSRPGASATDVDGGTPAAGAATGEAIPPSGGPPPTTTAEVHRRLSSINGSPPPPSPTAVPPADDPVVRPAPAGSSGSAGGAPISGNNSSNGGAATSPAVVATTVPPLGDNPVSCPAAAVNVTVATERATYSVGETVRGSSTLENRSATTCLLPTRAFFRIVDAGGRTVGSFTYTLELRLPVKAEPGRSFTSTFTWDQRDCSGASCDQVPAGTYVAVADWNESGPYGGRASFEITT